ncbi:MAG: hypothetical protein FWE64_03405 [Alphaproteobacteria bacterium]|nr:hypothetical protein [Alphaproteobacteria bacterium]
MTNKTPYACMSTAYAVRNVAACDLCPAESCVKQAPPPKMELPEGTLTTEQYREFAIKQWNDNIAQITVLSERIALRELEITQLNSEIMKLQKELALYRNTAAIQKQK